jgi:hypothetical protein
MARTIDPHRFDKRRSKLAAELVGTLDGEERRALALVLRHKVSGRWTRAAGAWAVAILGASRRGCRPIEVADPSAALGRLVAAGWLRFVPQLEGRGYFWQTHAGEDVVHAAGVNAPELDPNVPA